MTEEIFWQITQDEIKTRTRKILPHAIAVLFMMTASALAYSIFHTSSSVGYWSPEEVVLLVIVFLALFGIVYVWTLYGTPKEYEYHLNDRGILVSKGVKKMFIPWSDCVSFYQYTRKIGGHEMSIIGDSVFIELHSRFGRRFAVMYVEADQYDKVITFLASRLTEKTWTRRDDFGLKNFLFK
jgi:hypothetical protein